MRQINNTPWPVTVPGVPAEVGPGETIDWPDPITGLTPLDPPPEVVPVPDTPADPSTLPQPTTPPPGKQTPSRVSAAARRKSSVAEAPTSGGEDESTVKE
ncbi:Hypothetical protein AJAP_42410 (plasmid) [Amycolatopsis japonica]|uniref:Uncharacterized protein n=1 Tax=Amycolatopsis japonica TaxID=208439 RepID=A0A075V732_9PSEU|nr:hypothetical protein [Amycolatopsis japonica]AIG81253.1 Hypothetical protein AJAP_42410 [Amycolatopsis japonica]